MMYAELVREVARREGVSRPSEEVRRDMRAVLAVLGGLLPDDLRKRVAVQLPPPADDAMLVARTDRVPEAVAAEELYRRVARRRSLRLGVALERAQVICLVIGDAVDLASAEALADAFGEHGEALFFERPIAAPPPRPHRPSGAHTIADGRPGSTHPLSEAAPHETSHRHSVASTYNPHGTRKMSSGGARGDDIADGRSPR
ncbi:MAG: DUF2267 domain-containing protein [Myxococcales bacterium]|nr:DUF2267 domain-containing protein [Myxococcales bacterium]